MLKFECTLLELYAPARLSQQNECLRCRIVVSEYCVMIAYFVVRSIIRHSIMVSKMHHLNSVLANALKRRMRML